VGFTKPPKAFILNFFRVPNQNPAEQTAPAGNSGFAIAA